MFSKEALVSMADGTFKPISSIIKGDVILNKFYQKCNVLEINVHQDQKCKLIQLNNDTTPFGVSPNSIVLCHYRTPNSLKSEYCYISTAYTKNSILKSNLRLFSPDSDVLIETYTDVENQTLYSLRTSDNSQSYLINKIITTKEPSHY